jgi:hypothetical protein
MSQKSQLVIIGGPSCSGKSLLIDKIKQGDRSCLCEQLGIDDPSLWNYVFAAKLPHVLKLNVKRLVVHYDLHSRYSQENGFYYFNELINNYESIIVLTLCIPPKTLIQRNRRRMIKLCVSLLFAPLAYKQKIHHFRIRQRRQNTNKAEDGVSTLYEKWFNVINEHNLTSYWLDSGRPDTLLAHPYESREADVKNVIAGNKDCD